MNSPPTDRGAPAGYRSADEGHHGNETTAKITASVPFDYAERYRKHGWTDTLPLPPQAKEPPPAGFTGREGASVSTADVQAWRDGGGYRNRRDGPTYAVSNIAIRLPALVVGIDVDAHSGKNGAATLAGLEVQWGPLPPTWASTSRDDGISGIRQYRVPPGTDTATWPNKAGDAIDIIRRAHRYVVAPPSVHPSGARYRWIRPDGTTANDGEIPMLGDLPELPAAWIAGLSASRNGHADVTPSANGTGTPNTSRVFTPSEAGAYLASWLERVRTAQDSNINNTLNDGAVVFGHFAAAGYIDAETAARLLLDAVSQTVYDARTWQAEPTIRSGMSKGMSEPYIISENPFDGIIAPSTALEVAPTPPHPYFPRFYEGTWWSTDGQPLTPEILASYQAQVAAQRQQFAPRDFSDLYLPRSALADLPRGEPLIDGVLDRHALAVLSGRDGSYKSFLALSWLCSLATGIDWLGRPVERTRCLYVVGEGAWGLNDRLAAWETAWQTKVDDDWLTIRRAPVNLAVPNSEPFADLIRRVADGKYGVVVFDTLQRCAAGADTNSAKDAGIIVGALDQVRQATDNGSIVVVAHTGKADVDTRGSSVFEDDSDIVWHLKRDEDDQVVTARLAKRKDGPDGLVLELRASSVPGTGSLSLSISGGANALAPKPAPRGSIDVLKILAGPSVGTNGLSATAIGEAIGVAKSSVHNCLNHLIDVHLVQKVELGRWPSYKITVQGSSRLAEIGENPL